MKDNHNAPIIEWGVAAQKLTGMNESGDQYFVGSFHPDGHSPPHSVLVSVVDGLGHGPKAAVVAKTTLAALEGHAHHPLTFLLERCHKSLRGTRGVVMSLASFDSSGNMTWLGVGNVEGVLLRAGASTVSNKDERLVLRGGIVGYRLPRLRPVTLPVDRGDMLIFATDGLRSGFARVEDKRGSVQQIADRIFEEHHRGTDDALVLVARYVGGKGM
jgi:negative regulator of sigma-B (phosphoserine phosphatase)